MKAATADERREIDRRAIKDYGIGAELLMGFAGRAVADCALDLSPRPFSAAVFCGAGNNGGDGFAAAYFLANSGYEAEVFFAGGSGKLSPESGLFRDLCVRSGVSVNEVSAGGLPELSASSVIIEALTGAGFSGAPRGLLKDIIGHINFSGIPVVSADIPAGLPSDGDAPEWEAVRARRTVTMGVPLISLVTHPGATYAGELTVADIGFPRALTASPSLKAELAGRSLAAEMLCRGSGADTHKGERGALLIAGGFEGMEGAALLAAEAAFKAGAGTVTLLTSPAARKAAAGRMPELMTIAAGAKAFAAGGRKYGALVIGPGLGRTPEAARVFADVMKKAPSLGVKSVIIDGDGIHHLKNLLSQSPFEKGTEYIITPHFREAESISGFTVENIKKNRFRSAGEIARMLGIPVLLKGPRSIISDGTISLINDSGNPALACAGSGDTLSGITGAFSLRGRGLVSAAAAAAWVHGRAADIYAVESGGLIMKAGDICSLIPRVFKELSPS